MYLLYVGLEYLHLLRSECRLLVQNLLAAYVLPAWDKLVVRQTCATL